MRTDVYILLELSRGFRHLFPQHLFVDRHDQHVVEVELQPRVHKYPNYVREVIQLVFAEKLVVQVEGTEHHVHHRHVVLVAAVERVVVHRHVRAAGVENTQLVEAASMMDVREEAIEEFQVTLAVENDHRNLVLSLRRADAAMSPGIVPRLSLATM